MAIHEFVVETIKNYWSPGHKILEIGCGGAHMRKIFGSDYIGTDVTKDPYNEKVQRDVDIVCYADNIPMPDGSVEIVIVKSAFYLFPDYQKALQESFRILKPEGYLLIFDYNRRTLKQISIRDPDQERVYPSWTQWGLARIVSKIAFKKVKILVAESVQPRGIKRWIRLLRQEILGDWAIVLAQK